LINFFLVCLIGLSGCKKQTVKISVEGKIINHDPSKEYSILILDTGPFKRNIIASIENDAIVDNIVTFGFETRYSFDPVIEVWEDDTIRCILTSSSNDYLENLVTKKTFPIQHQNTGNGFELTIDNIEFEIDRTKSRVLDYNLRFVIPALQVENNYMKISGTLDPYPEGSKYTVFTDAGGTVEEFEFYSNKFEINTIDRTDFINIYITSKYSWSTRLKEYDIQKFSLHFSDK